MPYECFMQYSNYSIYARLIAKKKLCYEKLRIVPDIASQKIQFHDFRLVLFFILLVCIVLF